MTVAAQHGQGGSALIEVVVAIGILAVLVAATATSHRSAAETVHRSDERIGHVRQAEQELAASSLGDPAMTTLVPGAAPPVCGASPLGTAASRRVAIRRDGGTLRSETWLVGPMTAGVATSSPLEESHGALRVHLPDVVWSSPPEVELRSSDGLHPMLPGPSGCFEARELPVGTYEVLVRVAGLPLIDPTHVPLDVRPNVVTVRRRNVDVHLDAREATELTVRADLGGGRPPDDVRPGSLGWLIGDDDARQVTALGSSRAVHPGDVGVVVSACANPDATASRATIRVVGPTASIDVRLATAVVDGIDGRTDAVLELIRAYSCADGSGSRPSLRWIGGLRDGLRIALPAGVWDARLLSATGARLTTATQVSLGGAEGRVSIP